MNQGRIIVITGSPGTGKTTTASIVAKESNMDKSVHMHTDDFFHYLSKGAIPPHLPESNEQNLVVIEAFLEAAKRYARGGYAGGCGGQGEHRLSARPHGRAEQGPGAIAPGPQTTRTSGQSVQKSGGFGELPNKHFCGAPGHAK